MFLPLCDSQLMFHHGGYVINTLEFVYCIYHVSWNTQHRLPRERLGSQ